MNFVPRIELFFELKDFTLPGRREILLIMTAHACLLVWLCKFANGERQTCERKIEQRPKHEVKREAKEIEMWVFVRLEKRQI
jgi:hypothetical protein